MRAKNRLILNIWCVESRGLAVKVQILLLLQEACSINSTKA